MKLSTIDKQRFCSKLSIDEIAQCWIWQGSKNGNGYGAFWLGRQNKPAHRISLQIFTGIKLHYYDTVMHKCDNPMCVNPSHLQIGNQKDNMHDMIAKNRKVVGEACNFSKINEETVRTIRAEYKTGTIKQNRLAEKYNLSQTNISDIIRNNIWRHVK